MRVLCLFWTAITLGWFFFQPLGWTEGLIFFIADGTLYSMQPTNEKPIPILNGIPGLPPKTSLSPDGMSLAVVNLREEPDVIQVFDLGTGRASPIHLKEQEVREARYSPDGRWIAFSAKQLLPGGEVNRKGSREVFIVNSKGGTLRQVTFGIEDAVGLTWFSDSRTLFYRKFHVGNRQKIWKVAIVGKTPPRRQRLFHEDARFLPAERFYAFSPSGKEIAYATFGGIYVANVDGTNRRRVTSEEFRFTLQVAWSPTGRYLVFSDTEGRGDFTRLYILSLETEVTQLLVEMQTYVLHPTWVRHPLAVHPAGKLTTMWGALKRSFAR